MEPMGSPSVTFGVVGRIVAAHSPIGVFHERYIWRCRQDGDIVFLDLLIPPYGIICLGIIRLSYLIV